MYTLEDLEYLNEILKDATNKPKIKISLVFCDEEIILNKSVECEFVLGFVKLKKETSDKVITMMKPISNLLTLKTIRIK